ncbi:hypothetical protein HX096_12065 [Empedobacter falsenii]|uniref:hypothetical protein n=1 Tax=Empedobacter falsenii TaxID=343874 RepID=UPI0025764F26|nr:hypothetical protein [Empedobacter falsenii]MDM1548588.1 hypothetical protein [Empedobacter falsenii]
MNITFPNFRRTEAEYRPNEFAIYLYNVNINEVYGNKDNVKKNVDSFRLLVHEIRHYTDHISTFWGLNNIMMHNIAINARINEDIDNYHYLYDYYKLNKQLYYDEYYTLITNDSNVNKYTYGDDPWRFDINLIHKYDNTGRLNKENPLICINFYKSIKDNRFLARVPLSIVSILEVNAIFEELMFKSNILNDLPKDESIVENMLFQKEIFEELIYNKDLVVYNVIVHLTASVLNITDLMEALSIASKIGTVSLNLTSEDLENMKVCDFILNYNNEGKEYAKNFIRQHDLGFVFLNLLFNYRKKFNSTRIYDIDDLLRCSNLKDKDIILHSLKTIFADGLTEILKNNSFRYVYSDHISRGIEILEKKGLDGSKSPAIEMFNGVKYRPFVFFKDIDYELIDIDKDSFVKNGPYLTNYQQIEFIQYSDFFNSLLDEFINACDK